MEETTINIKRYLVTRFLDDIVYAPKFSPDLSTVSNAPSSFAELGLALMFKPLEDKKVLAEDLTVGHSLIMRDFTAPSKRSVRFCFYFRFFLVQVLWYNRYRKRDITRSTYARKHHALGYC